MWKDKEKAPILEFLGWVLLISVISNVIALALETYYRTGLAGGEISVGYVIYVINGVLIDTPTPMIATYIVLKRHHKIESIKDFIKLIVRTPDKKKTYGILVLFCATVLVVALLYGTRNNSPWYLMIVAYPVLIIGGGVEEIGWRGFLQPQLERKFPFILSTLITASIWITWHLPLWLMPSSNHYGDSILGFAIMLFSWSFIGAAIYKATRSPLACVLYHAFINSIGAIYNWNALFDAWPNKTGIYCYFILMVVISSFLWMLINHKEKKQRE
ncbi:CPBP family intramembrane glutamic endopeptidase [Anaerocolumna sp. MB42-C2]|uniref:CPBP family intramembrane glutamic endopeptidase n=1 Tax=Anaerocolumna sp. MB42-C2 TaxID=3070997 RepID=UPI0027E20FC7|nr:CPBP family intramembrane glutamic endopeptidase [Anaerocolumna sp. MB42-C2]WMJ89227.1 CPBP family intramembrane glutamic endopeptidase [Anaerocolumna sp. MB42-C2]